MRKSFLPLFLAAVLLLSGKASALAGPVIFTPRENVIFTTLDRMQEREDAIKDAMREAQLRLAEIKPAEKKEKPAQEEKGGQDSILGAIIHNTHPYFKFEVFFDDNIDLTAYDKKTSVVNTYHPGFKTNFRGEWGNLNIDTNWRYKRFNNRSDENIKEAKEDILATFRLGRFNFSLSETYTYDFIAATHANETEDVDDMDVEWRNVGAMTLGRYFNRTGFDFKYKYEEIRYTPAFRDESKSEQTFNFSQYLRLATKTRLLFEYEYFLRNFGFTSAEPDNSVKNTFYLSATTLPSAKISSLLKAGYLSENFKVQPNYQEIKTEASVSYRFSERTALGLDYQWVNHRSSTKSNYYTRNYFKVNGNHRLAFFPKLYFSFNCDYDEYCYSKRSFFPNPEKQKNYIFGCGLSYACRQWLDFKLDYEYKRYKDNENPGDVDNDYVRNKVTFKAEARF